MRSINFNAQTIKYHLRDEVDESVFNEIFKFHEYRQAEDVISKASGAILDVGAHAGFFSLLASALNKRVKICALEPENNNFLALRHNLQLNPSLVNIKIFNLALGAHSGQQILYLSPDSHNHSLVKDYNQTNVEVEAKTISLEDFCKQQKIARISLLKMDIEGGEHEIINSFTTSDYSVLEYLFLEVHKTDLGFYESLEKTLRTNGFGVQVFPCRFSKDLKFILAHNKQRL